MEIHHLVFSSLFLIFLIPLVSYIAYVDIHQHRIPNWCNLALAFAGLLRSSTIGQDQIAWSLLSGLLAFGSAWAFQSAYYLIRKRVGLGFGDVKFLGAAATWIGLEYMPIYLLIATSSALMIIAIQVIAGRKFGLDYKIPFGPFLGLSLIVIYLNETGLNLD